MVDRETFIGDCSDLLELSDVLNLIYQILGHLVRRVANAIDQNKHLEVHFATLVAKVLLEVCLCNRQEATVLVDFDLVFEDNLGSHKRLEDILELLNDNFAKPKRHDFTLALDNEQVSQLQEQVEAEGQQERLELLVLEHEVLRLSHFGDLAFDLVV